MPDESFEGLSGQSDDGVHQASALQLDTFTIKGHSPPSADCTPFEGEAGVLDPTYTYRHVKSNHFVGSALVQRPRNSEPVPDLTDVAVKTGNQ